MVKNRSFNYVNKRCQHTFAGGASFTILVIYRAAHLQNITILVIPLREDIKYYFADFVRKVVTDLGGTPLPPFTDNFFGEEGVTDLGGTPPPPLRTKSAK